MKEPVYRLSISCRQPGAVFRVTDGRSARVGTGMYRLDLDLPPGLYMVSTLLGASIESKTVLLDRSRTVEIEVSHGSFGDSAFSLTPRIRTLIPATHFGPGATTVVTVRGPYRRTPAKRDQVMLDVDGTRVAPAAADTLEDAAGGVWQCQLFRVDDVAADAPGILTAVRAVNGVETSHVVPRFANWMVWAAYPASKELAQDNFDLPLPHYARMRLTQPGTAPDLELQCLSDQVFTALASRSALPFSPPVLDLLFADDADPLLAVAAAHLASLTLGWYGFLEKLPQDEAGVAPQGAGEPGAPDREGEPTPLEELRSRIIAWLQRPGASAIALCPDVVAVRFLYGLCEEEMKLQKPPVLLRSLDALIKAEHASIERGRNCELDDSVWRTRFQVSDSFAYLQWETDESKGEKKRLLQMQQSFDMAQALEQSLAQVRQAVASVEGRGMRGMRSMAAAPDSAPAPEPAQERSQAMEMFIRKHAQALRLPTSALSAVTDQLLKSGSFRK